jgi:hypothetical protein
MPTPLDLEGRFFFVDSEALGLFGYGEDEGRRSPRKPPGRDWRNFRICSTVTHEPPKGVGSARRAARNLPCVPRRRRSEAGR